MVRCAKTLIGIDHHISNDGFGDFYKIDPQASATCEVLCQILKRIRFQKNVPSAYTQESCTIPECLSIQIQHVKRWNMRECYWRRVFQLQRSLMRHFIRRHLYKNQLLGKALLKSQLYADGQIIISNLSEQDFEELHASTSDSDGIIDQLRITKGVEAAIFLYPIENGYKVSMRSNEKVKVSEIAKTHGGGGHVQAAGCSMKGTLKDIQSMIISEITEQL